jgi:putative acetyltransferase
MAASLRLEPLNESHFERLHGLFDAVCRERRFMAFTDGGSRASAFSYYADIVAAGHAHVVALEDGRVVGWCDVIPLVGQMRAHAGVLGMAVAADARGRGIGRRLIEAAIAKATERDLTRIELTVHAENHAARALYERVGFEHEGTHRRGWCLDGRYHDVHHMARLADG